MHNLEEQHMNTIIHILRYLKGTHGRGIMFTKHANLHCIKVYTDAD